MRAVDRLPDSAGTSIGTLLERFLATRKLDQARTDGSLVGSWAEIVGPRLADASRVVDVTAGRVIVEADHQATAHLINLESGRITRAIAHRYPELGVNRISTIIGRTAPDTPGHTAIRPLLHPERSNRTPAPSYTVAHDPDEVAASRNPAQDAHTDTAEPGTNGNRDSPVTAMFEDRELRDLFERLGDAIRVQKGAPARSESRGRTPNRGSR